MTFLQVQYFLKVCETGNISGAAQELFMTRSALSKAIRELEGEFDTELFERTPSGLVPTNPGEALRQKALELVLLMDETGDLMRSVVRETEEHVRLGITPTTGITIFPVLYRGLSRLHPEIRLTPLEGGNTLAQSLLESGRMDACVTTWSEEFPDDKGRLSMTDSFDFARLRKAEMVFCTAPGHPLSGAGRVSAADILREPLVFMKKPLQREAELIHRFMAAGGAPNVVFRASQLAIAAQVVRCGMASSLQIKGTIDDGREIIGVPLSPPAVYTDVLVWNRKSLRKRGFRTFLDFCLNYKF